MAIQGTALVVETNYLIAAAIEGPLAAAGYQVVVAINQAETEAAITEQHIEVAIIDFRLQHGGPEGLVARLTAAGIPYVFCTAATTAEVLEHFPGARVVEKPIVDAELLALVAEAARGPAVPPGSLT